MLRMRPKRIRQRLSPSYLIMNFDKPLFRDKRLREVLNLVMAKVMKRYPPKLDDLDWED